MLVSRRLTSYALICMLLVTEAHRRAEHTDLAAPDDDAQPLPTVEEHLLKKADGDVDRPGPEDFSDWPAPTVPSIATWLCLCRHPAYVCDPFGGRGAHGANVACSVLVEEFCAGWRVCQRCPKSWRPPCCWSTLWDWRPCSWSGSLPGPWRSNVWKSALTIGAHASLVLETCRGKQPALRGLQLLDTLLVACPRRALVPSLWTRTAEHDRVPSAEADAEEAEPPRWAVTVASEALVSFWVVCADGAVRSLAVTALAAFLDRLDGQAHLQVLGDLLARCPYTNARGAFHRVRPGDSERVERTDTKLAYCHVLFSSGSRAAGKGCHSRRLARTRVPRAIAARAARAVGHAGDRRLVSCSRQCGIAVGTGRAGEPCWPAESCVLTHGARNGRAAQPGATPRSLRIEGDETLTNVKIFAQHGRVHHRLASWMGSGWTRCGMACSAVSNATSLPVNESSTRPSTWKPPSTQKAPNLSLCLARYIWLQNALNAV